MDGKGRTGWLAGEGMSKRLEKVGKKRTGSGGKQWTVKEKLDGLLRE